MSRYQNPKEYDEYLEKVKLELDDYNEIMFRKILRMTSILKDLGLTKDQIYKRLKIDLAPFEDFGDDEMLLPLLEKEGLI